MSDGLGPSLNDDGAYSSGAGKERKIFILRRDQLELVLSISEEDSLLAEQLKVGLVGHIREMTSSPSHNGDKEPMSRVDLLLCWTDYLLHQAHDCAPKQVEEGRRRLLGCALDEFTNALQGRNAHFLREHVQALTLKRALRIYYEASQATGHRPVPGKRPAILANDAVKLSAVFGGQGNTHDHLGEVRELLDTYGPLIADVFAEYAQGLANISRQYIEPPIDLERWTSEQVAGVDEDYLNRSSVSLSLVGLVQLLNYVVLLRTAGYAPAEMAARFTNATGHSQGIVSAVVFAASQSFEDVRNLGGRALRLLFLVGYRAEQVFSSMPSNAISASECLPGVSPTPMLSISNLSEADLQAIIQETTQVFFHNAQEHDYMAKSKKIGEVEVEGEERTKKEENEERESGGIEIALVNSPRSFVCSGPTRSLQALHAAIEDRRAKADEDQSRVPFSQRKKVCHTRFLPISTPFHHSSLQAIIEPLRQEVVANGASFQGVDLRIPLVCPHSGIVMQGSQKSLDAYLIESICTQKVNWMLATSASFHPKITHFVDFGPGGLLGIGVLTHRVREGSGIKVILASTNSAPPSGLLNRLHLLDDGSVSFGANWRDLYGPKVCMHRGRKFVDTKFSRLLNKPPVMVAGMTPTTVSADINVAVANAGYHIELAGGGHFTEALLEQKIAEIMQRTPTGSGITLNALFLNPRLWNQQYPLALRLRRQGVPLEGVTIAAGVPTLPVANEIIAALRDAGFKHVAFKPGSTKAILEVAAIAKANPTFPIILQWTGGRAGGHHSYEDFHQPMLDNYAALRSSACNLILVAGSGFGDGEHSLPYLTGDWSVPFGYPPMPFDAILLASRMLVCAESKLSLQAKELLVATPGVTNEGDWETSYAKPAGGIVTVMSELGEPIHKVATRSVLLWKELDDTVFSLPRDRRLPALTSRKAEIIRRLNGDHQKVWFPQDADGQPVDDLTDMTYGDVLLRLVQLCYVRHQDRWIDAASHQPLVFNWAHRIEQRFCRHRQYHWSAFPPQGDPTEACQAFLSFYGPATKELVSVEDMHYFVHICSNYAMKPVPFIPRLDENFEGWFKRDSLGAAEDLDAVPNRDVQRVCILQGPVAVRYSTQVDEPAANILDDIHGYYIAQLEDATNQIRTEEEPSTKGDDGCHHQWIRDLVSQDFVVDGKTRRLKRNGFHGYSCTAKGDGYAIGYAMEDGLDTKVTVSMQADNQSIDVIIDDGLRLKYRYEPRGTVSTILTADQDYQAISDFYWRIWFPQAEMAELEKLRQTEPWDVEIWTRSTVDAQTVQAFCQTVRNLRYINQPHVPMDYVIVIAWPTVTKLLFAKGVSTENNLLSLVHLNNKYVSLGVRMTLGQTIESRGRITALQDTPSGRLVQVEAVAQDAHTKQPIMRIVSQFLFREGGDQSVSFERRHLALDAEIIKALREGGGHSLLPEDLSPFKAMSLLHVTTRNGESQVKGELLTESNDAAPPCTFECGGPLEDLWRLVARPQSAPKETIFEQPQELGEETLMSLSDSAKYSHVSGDHNPIHTRPLFARLAGLPQPITHGMWSSAALKGLTEAKLLPMLPMLKGLGLGTEREREEEVVEWQTDFVDIVHPGDNVRIALQQTGLRRGLRIVQGLASVLGRPVVKFSALLTPMPTAYVFTGQGSQVPNMGMDLYAKSAVARRVWDRADEHFRSNYGFSILDIVRRNPAELTVHFGGLTGPVIRENYRNLMVEMVMMEEGGGSRIKEEPLFPDIHDVTESYTFKSPAGLLNATQFTQPALVLFEKAAYEDMLDKGLVPQNVRFAGHSLGEYAALAAIGNVISDEDLCDIVFYRGLTMQRAVPRDPVSSRSGFGMIAVNPSRVHVSFDAHALEFVIQGVRAKAFLEIVNYNVEGQQYVVAGTLEALECLTQLMNLLWHQKIDIQLLRAKLSEHDNSGKLRDISSRLHDMVEGVWAEKCQAVVNVSKGIASLPLPGIDVPFHSSFLLSGVPAFRSILSRKLKVKNIHVHRLNGKYVPNLIGKTFYLNRDFIRLVHDQSHSPVIKQILEEWREPASIPEQYQLGHKVLVELLAYQFASPVQWIKTQQTFFESMDIQQLIEVGPGPILTGMAERTLKRYAKSDAILGRKRRVQSYQRDHDDIYHWQRSTSETIKSSPQQPVNKPQLSTPHQAPPPNTPGLKASKDERANQVQVPRDAIVKAKMPVAKKIWDKLPFTVLDSLQVLLGYKLKKRDIPSEKSIKELSMGKSTLQNELFGDLLREFGDGKTPENKAEELSLHELAKEIEVKLGPSMLLPGRQIQTYINKMASAKFNSLAQLEDKLASQYGIQGGQPGQAVLAYGLLSEPAQRLIDDAQVNDWLWQTIEHFSATKHLDHLKPSTTSEADATNTAVVSSEELKTLERKQLDLFRRQLDLLAEHTGDTGRDILTALQKKAAECQVLRGELDLWNLEYTPEHLELIKPHFNPKQLRTFNSYWNWAHENIVRLLRTGQGDPEQIINCADDSAHLPEFAEFMAHRLAAAPIDAQPLKDSAKHAPLTRGPKLCMRIRQLVRVCDRRGRLNARLTHLYRGTLVEDVQFAGKVALITGAGPRSIGSELVAYLLRGGAHVLVTTSSFARNVGFFETIYRRNCAKGSVLRVVPFNAASQSDCLELIRFVHDSLKLELDIFVPLGAINEVGRDVMRLDAVSEAAHRAMLVNVERMLGTIVEHKRQREQAMRPLTVILPLSPNNGDFGGDGLYGESKAALKAVLNKWHSERSWAPFARVIGAVIGWTKGTGLMAENDALADYLERKCGLQVFEAKQMAWLLACLVKLPYGPPCVAQLTGGLDDLMDRFNVLIDKAKPELMAALKRSASQPVILDLKANIDFGFLLWHRRHPESLGNGRGHACKVPKSINAFDNDSWLDETVVLTGYGEVGPWGNARTRWALESRMRAGLPSLQGLLPMEAIIELAWLMGLVELHKDGWHDAGTKECIPDHQMPARYEPRVLINCGIRRILAQDAQGYDPERKPLAQEIVLTRPLGPLDVTREEAEALARYQPPQFLEIKSLDASSIIGGGEAMIGGGGGAANDDGGGRYAVKLLPGATLLLPTAANFDRLVAGLLPSGWSAERLGLPADLARQVDPTTAYTLAAACEALLASGLTDPYELYAHVHVSQVGNTIGGGNGGMASNRHIFTQRFRDQQLPNDILQESFINTMPAWVNMLLLSSSGPMRTAVGACATALASLDAAVDLLRLGKARVVLCGGNDDFGEQGSYEFAQMGATSNAVHEFAQGRPPWQHCRPATDSRGGFLESHGAGVQVLMTARTALQLGAPMYAVVAVSHTASDGASRSVPAPGQGVLSNAGLISRALHDWNLTIDELDVAMMHGTGTKANDWNECSVLGQQLKHWGRTPGKAIATVWQKHLTGHPKAPAAAWMINGAVQVLNAGLLPGHGTLDNVDPQLREFGDYLWIPSEPHDFDCTTPFFAKPGGQDCREGGGLRTALVKSFGFGQVGGEVLLLRGDLLLQHLDAPTLVDYGLKLMAREQKAKHYWQQVMMHDAAQRGQGLIRVKQAPPYPMDQAAAVYLDPNVRINADGKLFHRPQANNATDRNHALQGQQQAINAKLLDPGRRRVVLDKEPSSANGDEQRLRAMLEPMMDSGFGLDVQSIADFPADNPNFLADNFTPRELEQLHRKPDRRASSAGRWAAKEAVYKCLSQAQLPLSDERHLRWIEIVSDEETGVPLCSSHPRIHLSISHSGDYAVAIAKLV